MAVFWFFFGLGLGLALDFLLVKFMLKSIEERLKNLENKKWKKFLSLCINGLRKTNLEPALVVNAIQTA